MPLKGEAFMIIWHDIRAESERDYHLWHTREHMPERLGVPGFLRGRRGVDWTRDKYRYLTLYEGEKLATFGSAPYLERLNNPTEWSLRVQPAFYNFVRSACAITATAGRGVGGAMATLRVGLDGIGENVFCDLAPGLVDELLVLEGACAVHAGVARSDVTGAKTREIELRGTQDIQTFDAVILIDGVGRREIEALMPAITRCLERHAIKVDPADTAVYDMAYCLEPAG